MSEQIAKGDLVRIVNRTRHSGLAGRVVELSTRDGKPYIGVNDGLSTHTIWCFEHQVHLMSKATAA